MLPRLPKREESTHSIYFINYFLLINSMIILLLCILLLFILFSYFIKEKEHYCKVPKVNRQGVLNDITRKLDYISQSDIYNSNCDKYWKKYATEYNSVLRLDEPIPIESSQLKIPKTSNIANRVYLYGLFDFQKVGNLVNDPNISIDKLKNASLLLINPVTKEKLRYEYEVDFHIRELNLKTDKKRFNEYNPSKKNTFPYIPSPIPEVNRINQDFLHRLNTKQIQVASSFDKIKAGLLLYQPYGYRIITVKYIDKNPQKAIYVIQMLLFQEFNYYINSFAYIGFIENNQVKIFKTEFIGVNQSSNYLSAPGYDKTDPTNFFILNKNFNDFQPRIKEIDEVIEIVDNKNELRELSEQYACFNSNVDSSQVFLKYSNKNDCESPVDHWGKSKPVGLYDKPCKENEECPFYKINKNYNNNFGGCINGKCELPLNMKRIGYHYYSNSVNDKPLCYNCDSKDVNLISSDIDSCCEDQYNKKEYPKFKSPDYAFKNDIVPRINSYNKRNYKSKYFI